MKYIDEIMSQGRTLKEKIDTVICGDALSVLKILPPESVDCIVTSPPYW